MTYGEQIRHPSGAVGDKDEELRQKFWRFLGFAAIVGVVLYFAWRMGWLGKVAAAGASAVKSIPNPHGWV